jgi:hypothetical protein
MPPRQPARGINANTFVIGIPLIAASIGIFRSMAPLAVIPTKVEQVDVSVKAMRRDVDDVSKVQAVQTDALQRLAKIAEEGQQMRRDVDKADTEIREVKRRLDRLETR